MGDFCCCCARWVYLEAYWSTWSTYTICWGLFQIRAKQWLVSVLLSLKEAYRAYRGIFLMWFWQGVWSLQTQKWWFGKGNPLISGKPRLLKYHTLARICVYSLVFQIPCEDRCLDPVQTPPAWESLDRRAPNFTLLHDRYDWRILEGYKDWHPDLVNWSNLANIFWTGGEKLPNKLGNS